VHVLKDNWLLMDLKARHRFHIPFFRLRLLIEIMNTKQQNCNSFRVCALAGTGERSSAVLFCKMQAIPDFSLIVV
jgi:hypothetical protein